jgi:hypothetical protein
MAATWFLGDIHGCADELAELLERLALTADDRLVSLGDLYHRGPDPAGVARILTELASTTTLDIILGNHERVLNARADDSLAGDGGSVMGGTNSPADVEAILALIVDRPYFLRGTTPSRQQWLAVHAGVIPGVAPEQTDPFHLTRVRRLEAPGKPNWHELWQGPELVLYGHTPAQMPRATHFQGRLVSLGLDTGCVYGGALTAYRVEDGELEVGPARRRYVE